MNWDLSFTSQQGTAAALQIYKPVAEIVPASNWDALTTHPNARNSLRSVHRLR